MARPIVLCVQNEAADTLGIAPRLLRDAGCEVAVLRAFDDSASWPAIANAKLRMDPPPSLSPARGEGDTVAGLAVFGGEMNADQLDDYPYLRRVRQLMRDAVDLGVPTLGICLGAQLLARAHEAPVFRAPVRELGFLPIVPTVAAARDPLLAEVRAGDRLFQWHEDTFDMPAGATLLATGESGLPQAYRIGPGAWGVQFHPEIDAEQVERWLRESGEKLESTWGRTRDQVMAELRAQLPAQQRRARALFSAFAAVVSESARR